MLDDSHIDFGTQTQWKVKRTKESEYIPCCLESSWLVNLVKVYSLVKQDPELKSVHLIQEHC